MLYKIYKQCLQHSTTVNQLSVDDNGDYIASCSDDGKVCLGYHFITVRFRT